MVGILSQSPASLSRTISTRRTALEPPGEAPLFFLHPVGEEEKREEGSAETRQVKALSLLNH